MTEDRLNFVKSLDVENGEPFVDLQTGLQIRPQQIYVAGRANNGYEKIREIYNTFEELGHKITYRWSEGEIPVKPYRSPETKVGNVAISNAMLDGILNADVFIMLYEEKLEGAIKEEGAFLMSCFQNATHRRAYVVGKGSKEDIFDARPHQSFVDGIEEVYVELDFWERY